MTDGQNSAIAQLRAIERIGPDAVEIVKVRPPDTDGFLRVDVSIDCHGVQHLPGGVRLRGRERFVFVIGPTYPFTHPSVFSGHKRWAGTAHVQWGRSLCLYAAPSVEWNPGYGMVGFLERLWLWLKAAAAGELDPAGAPLHPPVAYPSSREEVPMIVPRKDTPEVTEDPWIGGVELDKVGDSRIDLGNWHHSITSWLEGAAPAILLPTKLDFEYPGTVEELLESLADRGVLRDKVLLIIKLAALTLKKDEPLVVVVGTAMRGTQEDRRQHLAAWYVSPEYAWGLSRSLMTDAEDSELRESAEKVKEIMDEWVKTAKIDWCPVREARPEVTRRRDLGSPLEQFQGKTVAIWGCGALGGPIAEWVVRAGASKVVLHDKSSVAPGILVRQPFSDADIGKNKAEVLAARLSEIRPGDVEIVSNAGNLLQSVLERDDWDDGAEIVIDATASSAVAAKLERIRRLHPAASTIVSMVIGHTAEHIMATITPAGYSGAGADAMRQVKLVCGRDPSLQGFLEEFWPKSPRTDLFQPEPGCSDPTFIGSGAEVAALAARALVRVAADLNDGGDRAAAHLFTTAATHRGRREVRLAFESAQRTFDKSGDTEVRLSPGARRRLSSEIESSRREIGGRSETGGLLYGEHDPAIGVIWVDEVSGPPPDSVRSPEVFICGTEGVAEQRESKASRGRGSLRYLGMWHSHPEQEPFVSQRDLQGIVSLLDASPSAIAPGLLMIVGHTALGPPVLGTFLFERTELENPMLGEVHITQPVELEMPSAPSGQIGIALSGGGSRAIAFHLGCLRALHDREILERTRVISSVSGGSVIAAMWAYGDEEFAAFDERVQDLLLRGLQRRIARRVFASKRAPQELATGVVAGGAAFLSRIAGTARSAGGRTTPAYPPFRRWVSRTDALADVLDAVLGQGKRITDPRRDGLDVVVNACELSTGSAFRFGSRESGCWRTGKLVENDVALSTAVAASAAYPLALPALDRKWSFEQRDGSIEEKRILLTDGGVYDNLGTTCLEPGRSPKHVVNHFDIDYVIACDAGQGLLDPKITYGLVPRIQRSVNASFRKLQDGGRGRLHAMTEQGQLKGFAMPYLGQRDRFLPEPIPDLVPRSAVVDYPTNFAAMNPEALEALSRRGEQLTNALIDAYLPEL